MKIEMRNQNAKTRKLISRMITKTQKYLVESEKLIMDKIFEVQQMQTKLAASEQDRQIHYDRREYAQRTFVLAWNERTNMRLHFERLQAEKDAENRLKDALRENRREGVMTMGQ